MLTNVSMDMLSAKYNSSVLAAVAEFLCSHNSNRSRPTVDLYCLEFPINYPVVVQIFVGVAFMALIVFALIGNGLVMWIIARHKIMHQSFYYFLFNLALADFLIALLNVGTSWTYNFYYDWWFGDFCPFNHYFGVVPTCVCVFTMMVVSWDRCAAVSNPLGKRHMSKTATILVLFGVWLLAAVIGLPSFLYSRVEKRYFYSAQEQRLFTQNLCVNLFPLEKEYNVLLLIINYVIPLFVLLATFLKIVLSLRQDSKDRLLNSNSNGHLTKRRRAVKMLALVMAIFIICWLPYQLYHTVLERYISNMSTAAYTYMAVYWLAMSTAMYNPVIYFFMNKRYGSEVS
uniref:G-protein coupled receptors family 1 profile domain-containing protein n=1 Tax=Plectus sambesii TaxID=2011161 RepID=A0A914WH49_9BILA